MVAGIIHAVVATDNEEGRLEMVLRLDGCVDLLYDGIHFTLLGEHVWTGGMLDI